MMAYQQPIRVREIAVTRRPVNHRGDWIFVALTDDAGRVGYGEASHSGDDAATMALLEGALADPIRTTAWDDPAAAWGILDAAAPAGTARRVAATAASAVEQALWDLRAQAEGTGLAALLAARPGAAAGASVAPTMPLYANINRATVDRTPGGFAANAARAVAEGFQTVKLAPFDEVAYGTLVEDRRRLAEPGLARVAAVRTASRPGHPCPRRLPLAFRRSDGPPDRPGPRRARRRLAGGPCPVRGWPGGHARRSSGRPAADRDRRAADQRGGVRAVPRCRRRRLLPAGRQAHRRHRRAAEAGRAQPRIAASRSRRTTRAGRSAPWRAPQRWRACRTPRRLSSPGVRSPGARASWTRPSGSRMAHWSSPPAARASAPASRQPEPGQIAVSPPPFTAVRGTSFDLSTSDAARDPTGARWPG